jgi:hypothetical protein
MKVEVELPPDIGAALAERARAAGLSLDQFAARTLSALAEGTLRPKSAFAPLMIFWRDLSRTRLFPKRPFIVRMVSRPLVGMDCLVDTNVWLRALATSHPMKAVARQAIRSLVRDGCRNSCIIQGEQHRPRNPKRRLLPADPRNEDDSS